MPRDRLLPVAVGAAALLGLLAWREAQAAPASFAGEEGLWIPFEGFETVPISGDPFLPALPVPFPLGEPMPFLGPELPQGDPFLRGEIPPLAYLTRCFPRCLVAYNAARAAGFTDDNACILQAIAQAESGCNPGALCDDCFPGVSERSVGLFQLNLEAHGAWLTESCARDPYCAARAAYQISGGSNFRPWTTYTSGRYLAYL